MESDAYLKMSQVERTHWWYVARRQIVRSQIERLGLKTNALVLEVGSGTGGNFPLLSNFGPVSAIEMDAGAREIAKNSIAGTTVDLRAGKLPEDNPFADMKFDLVVMLDVLEHIEDDDGTMKALFACMETSGKILITVPAYQWLWGPHDKVLHHKRRYTRTELRRVIEGAGLKVRKISYFNTFLFPLVALIRVAESLTGSNKVRGQDKPGDAMNRMLKTVFASERHVLKGMNFPFGVSLICIAEKTNG